MTENTDIENENIDKNEWLGKFNMSSLLTCNADVLIERRDDGRFRSAIRQPVTLMHWLRARELISNKHFEDGETYARWREILAAVFGNRRSGSRGESAGGLSEYQYVMLIRRLGKPHQESIERALDSPATLRMQAETHDGIRWTVRGREIASAFEILSLLIDEIRDTDYQPSEDGFISLLRKDLL